MTKMKAHRFTVGQEIEYGFAPAFGTTLGGHWRRCKVLEVGALGIPSVIEVLTKGEAHRVEVGSERFRPIPKKPWVVRNGSSPGKFGWSYFIQGDWMVQIGSFAEAHRFDGEKAARAALKQLGRGYVAMPVEMAQRDEDMA